VEESVFLRSRILQPAGDLHVDWRYCNRAQREHAKEQRIFSDQQWRFLVDRVLHLCLGNSRDHQAKQ
jgi:hypothetical protein